MLMLDILFGNEEVIVLDKPSGLRVHSDGRSDAETLVDQLLQTYPEIEGVGETQRLPDGGIIDRPGIVHRLDTDTSGVMVVARTQESFENLKKQFQEHQVVKIYHAFIYGSLPDEEGVIDRPIAKNKKNFRLWSAQRGARGKSREAVTEYKVLKAGPEYSFVELQPKTGRTHQLRVHMKAIHHPIVCDPLYAPNHDCLLGFGRLALHSKKISFKLLSGEKLSFEAPYPQDFQKALQILNL